MSEETPHLFGQQVITNGDNVDPWVLWSTLTTPKAQMYGWHTPSLLSSFCSGQVYEHLIFTLPNYQKYKQWIRILESLSIIVASVWDWKQTQALIDGIVGSVSLTLSYVLILAMASLWVEGGPHPLLWVMPCDILGSVIYGWRWRVANSKFRS